MREYIPIILAVSLVCGLLGTLLAKQARKKSSYPLLITSAILAVGTLAGVLASAVFLFLPSNVAVNTEMPAVLYDSSTGDILKTTLTFEGEWKYSNILKRNKSYKGKIAIDGLDHTGSEDISDCELKFSYFDDENTVLYDVYDYVSSGKIVDSYSLMTDEKGSWFYIDTGSSGYVIMAPAETAGEAKEISAAAGIGYSE